MSDARDVQVVVGNHDCRPPSIVGHEATATLGQSEGSYLRWSCECGSEWKGSREFERYWPGHGMKWQYGIVWRRATDSGKRWRKAEERRVIASLVGGNDE